MRPFVEEKYFWLISSRFLWASLHLQAICSVETIFEADLLEGLATLPQGSSAMYSKIMRQICESRPWGKKVAFRSLKWLLFQEVQLAMDEFLEAISIDASAEGATIKVSKANVLYICYNLIVHDKVLNIFRFAHLSVRE